MSLARVLAAVASGVAFVLAVPDTGWGWLGFGMLVPWLWAIEGLAPRRAAALGQVTGFVAMFGGFFWMTELLGRFAKMSAIPALLVHAAFSGIQAAQWAAASALYVWLRARTGRGPLVCAPLAFVAGEALAPHLFPTYVALAWWDMPLWTQLAEVGGVGLVGGALAAINAAAYTLTRGWDRRAFAVLVALLAGVPTFGAWRIAEADALAAASPTARFGVVQGNHGIREWSKAETKPDVLARLQAQSAVLDAEGVDVLLWGENTYPYRKVLPRDGGEDAPAWHPERVRVGFDAPLVLGAVTAEAATDGPVPDPTRNPYPWNSALVLHADGTFGDVYDKNYPLWFGEHAPLVDPAWYLRNVPGASHVNAGTEVAALRVGPWRLGALVCYEDILPRFVRRVIAEDVHVLVNLTSDTWFGAGAEPTQHLGLAVFRSIEHRRAMVRDSNTGPSALVDPAGRVVIRTAITDPDANGPAAPDGFVADVPMIDPAHRTFYARVGAWFEALVILAMVALAIRGSDQQRDAERLRRRA
ncbi:MAG: apolipoprotein N-acyltransferase [Myxococcota bacterium]